MLVIPIPVVSMRTIRTEGIIFRASPIFATFDAAVLVKRNRRDLLWFWLSMKLSVTGSDPPGVRLEARRSRTSRNRPTNPRGNCGRRRIDELPMTSSPDRPWRSLFRCRRGWLGARRALFLPLFLSCLLRLTVILPGWRARGHCKQTGKHDYDKLFHTDCLMGAGPVSFSLKGNSLLGFNFETKSHRMSG